MKKGFLIFILFFMLISCEDFGPMHTTFLSDEYASNHTIENAKNFTYEKEITCDDPNIKFKIVSIVQKNATKAKIKELKLELLKNDDKLLVDIDENLEKIIKENRDQIDVNCILYKKGFTQKKLIGNITIRVNSDGRIFIAKKITHD